MNFHLFIALDWFSCWYVVVVVVVFYHALCFGKARVIEPEQWIIHRYRIISCHLIGRLIRSLFIPRFTYEGLSEDVPYKIQGFQLLGIAWREKYWARNAWTHEYGSDPPIGPLVGSRGPRQSPLCKKICIWWGNIHNFRPLSSLNLNVYYDLGIARGQRPMGKKILRLVS